MSARFTSMRHVRNVNTWGDNIGAGVSLLAFVAVLILVGMLAVTYLK